MTADQEKIDIALAQLDGHGKILHDEAIGEGYKDEVCGECKTVLLAHQSFIRCGSKTCPKITRHPDGRPKTVFEIWDEADAKVDAKKATATT